MVVVQKVITCRIDINNINDQFCSDYSKMKLNKLQSQLIGKCYRGLLIINIINVIRSSYIRSNSKSLNGNFHMDITARVEGIIYEVGEIIPDAKVLNITGPIISASSKYANINIQTDIDKWTNILKPGDMTPVIVKISKYNLYSDKISVAAIPFIPLDPSPFTILICDDQYEQDYVIKNFIGIINDYHTYFSKLSKEQKYALDFFKKLLYPYKKTKKISTIKIMNKDFTIESVPIKNIEKLNNTAFDVLLLETDYLDDSLYIIHRKSDKETTPIIQIENTHHDSNLGKFNIINSNTKDGIKLYLTRYIKRLYCLLKFIETYPSKTNISESSHVWKYYELNKF